MIQQSTGVLNRLGLDIINWQYVESIDCNDEKTRLIIHYTSGVTKTIDSILKINKLLDLMSIFPDILNDDVRIQMKNMAMHMQQMQGNGPIASGPEGQTARPNMGNMGNPPRPNSPLTNFDIPESRIKSKKGQILEPIITKTDILEKP